MAGLRVNEAFIEKMLRYLQTSEWYYQLRGQSVAEYNMVYITDGNYVLPTKTSINSVVQNCPDKDIRIHVICVDVSEQKRNEIESLAAGNIRIQTLSFGNDYADLGLAHSYVSKAALFKFQLPEIFHDLDRILYVDGDMILSPEFTAIFDCDIADYYGAVCMDMIAMEFERWHEKIGHERYFNSGMMFLNLAKMRAEHIPEKLIDYKRNDSNGHFMDQNALNAVLGNNVLWISPKYNLMSTYARVKEIYGKDWSVHDTAGFFSVPDAEMAEYLKNPAVLHMASPLKVWNSVRAAGLDSWVPYLAPEDEFPCALNYIRTLDTAYQNLHTAYQNLHTAYHLGSNVLVPESRCVQFENFFPFENWGAWTYAPECSVCFYGGELATVRDECVLSFAVHTFESAHCVRVFFNDEALEMLEIEPESKVFAVKLPAEKIFETRNIVRFVGEGDYPAPAEVGKGDDERKLFLAFSSMMIQNPEFEAVKVQLENQKARLQQQYEALVKKDKELCRLIEYTKNHTLWGFCARVWHKLGRIWKIPT